MNIHRLSRLTIALLLAAAAIISAAPQAQGCSCVLPMSASEAIESHGEVVFDLADEFTEAAAAPEPEPRSRVLLVAGIAFVVAGLFLKIKQRRNRGDSDDPDEDRDPS